MNIKDFNKYNIYDIECYIKINLIIKYLNENTHLNKNLNYPLQSLEIDNFLKDKEINIAFYIGGWCYYYNKSEYLIEIQTYKMTKSGIKYYFILSNDGFILKHNNKSNINKFPINKVDTMAKSTMICQVGPSIVY